jgi:hypothetical protein
LFSRDARAPLRAARAMPAGKSNLALGLVILEIFAIFVVWSRTSIHLIANELSGDAATAACGRSDTCNAHPDSGLCGWQSRASGSSR